MATTDLNSAPTAPAIIRQADTTPGTDAARPWAVRARGIGKRYRLGGQQSINDNIREDIAGLFGRIAGRAEGEREDARTFWALRHVDLDVDRGETLGIIGRNGAGKSTLLKILSRITPPTEGEIVYRGRLASLLEVGTGFHRELTGRENIYLNGAILGMRRTEIDRQFDAIIDFAGVEKFLDTPVKHYSSGMYVRLAFAVAAHLRTDILIVDEVLAVGDAEFQKKCLGKMKDVASGGRTVLFVSHNMVAVEGLCSHAIWMKNGTPVMKGGSKEVLTRYLESTLEVANEVDWPDDNSAPGNASVRLKRVAIVPEGDSTEPFVDTGTPFDILVQFRNLVSGPRLHVTIHLMDEQGTIILSSASLFEAAWRDREFEPGVYQCLCRIPGDFLNIGLHRLRVLIVQDETRILLKQDDVLAFHIVDSQKRKTAWHGRSPGVVRPSLNWKTEKKK